MALFGGTKKTNYPYVVARVQARRGKLLAASDFEKMLLMDVSEITHFVAESVYKADVDELSARFSGLDLLEAALTVNEERSYGKIRQMMDGSGKEILEAFLLRNLVEDVKTLLRGKFGGASRDEMLKELLLEDLDTYNIFEPLLAEDVKSLEDVVARLLAKPGPLAPFIGALGKLPEDAGLSAYEDSLDKAYLSWLLDASANFKEDGSEAIRELVGREIDARNLANAARWVVVGAGKDFTPYVVPRGKYLRVAGVIKLSQAADLEEFKSLMLELGIRDAQVVAGLDATIASGRLAAFVTAVGRWHLAGLDKLSHTKPLSITPVLNYVIRKHLEVRRIRAVARGRDAGLTADRLKELLP